MRHIWQTLKYYYTTLAINYQVDPIIFICIHLIGTPVLIVLISWLIRNYQQKKSMLLPGVFSLIVYNVGNFYIIISGKNIGWYIYAIIAATTIISAYFTYKNIRINMRNSLPNPGK